MTITVALPQRGDEVAILTTTNDIYTGRFLNVTKNRAVRMTNACCGGRFIGQIQFKENDIRTMHIVVDRGQAPLVDPAIVGSQSYRGGNRNLWMNKQNFYRQNNANLYGSNNFSHQYTPGHQRGQQSHVIMHSQKPWPRRNAQGELVNIFRSFVQDRDQRIPRPRQNRFVPSQGLFQADQPWVRQTRRRPSEGVFPQRHPGMVAIPQEDYDFDAAAKEFKAKQQEMKELLGSAEAKDGDTQNSQSKTSKPIYDMTKFFDNLTLSNDNYEKKKAPPVEVKPAAPQHEQQQREQAAGNPGQKMSRGQLKDELFQTFDTKTVLDLYGFLRPENGNTYHSNTRGRNHGRVMYDTFNNDNTNGNHDRRNRHQNRMFRDIDSGHPSSNIIYDQRNAYAQHYRPTVQFHKNYHGAQLRFNRSPRDKHVPSASAAVATAAAAATPAATAVGVVDDAEFGSLMQAHVEQLLSRTSNKKVTAKPSDNK